MIIICTVKLSNSSQLSTYTNLGKNVLMGVCILSKKDQLIDANSYMKLSDSFKTDVALKGRPINYIFFNN